MSTIALIDWDDTLFPTSWVLNNNIPVKRSELFDKLDTTIYNFLTMLNCVIYIVTNAMLKWLDTSMAILPKTSLFIKNNAIIVSAKEQYFKITDDMNEWKKHAFKDITKNITNTQHIISIGDAEYEYNALICLNKHVSSDIFLKTIRLVQKPNINVLIDQLVTLTKTIHQYKNNKRHLDLVFKNKT